MSLVYISVPFQYYFPLMSMFPPIIFMSSLYTHIPPYVYVPLHVYVPTHVYVSFIRSCLCPVFTFLFLIPLKLISPSYLSPPCPHFPAHIYVPSLPSCLPARPVNTSVPPNVYIQLLLKFLLSFPIAALTAPIIVWQTATDS